MGVFLYRCAQTGLQVQAWSDRDQFEKDPVFEVVSCPACGLMHLVNSKPGKIMGERDASAS
jgi:DNA-directed RNA polymerase subunit RPC12/RpoP